MTKYANVLWLDLEMTGLDPLKDHILEAAAIATDWQFKEIADTEMVIHQPDDVLDHMNEWCVTQHGASGLTERSRQATLTSTEAEDALITFIAEHFKKDKPVLLGGNSIHMDRRFIAAHWPKLDALLHYRMLDVSAWKVVFEGKYRGQKFLKPEDHRALNDIRGSIDELQFYLQKVKG